jgi:hypothetical protein
MYNLDIFTTNKKLDNILCDQLETHPESTKEPDGETSNSGHCHDYYSNAKNNYFDPMDLPNFDESSIFKDFEDINIFSNSKNK